jgi:hypothetical protein
LRRRRWCTECDARGCWQILMISFHDQEYDSCCACLMMNRHAIKRKEEEKDDDTGGSLDYDAHKAILLSHESLVCD